MLQVAAAVVVEAVSFNGSTRNGYGAKIIVAGAEHLVFLHLTVREMRPNSTTALDTWRHIFSIERLHKKMI